MNFLRQNPENRNYLMGSLPFSSIPDAPASYSATTVMSRMMDGLGYRYYWASGASPTRCWTTELDHRVGMYARHWIIFTTWSR